MIEYLDTLPKGSSKLRNLKKLREEEIEEVLGPNWRRDYPKYSPYIRFRIDNSYFSFNEDLENLDEITKLMTIWKIWERLLFYLKNTK